MEGIHEGEQQMFKEVNPWKTIWYAPRTAVRSVIEHKTPTFAMVLAILAGVTGILDRAISKNLGDVMALPAILLIGVVGGMITGLLGWIVLSAVMTFVGKWFGGEASYNEMKMAIGAAYIPFGLSIILYILDMLLLGERLFMDVAISTFQMSWMLVSAFIAMILYVWSMFLVVKGIAEAHRFSSWKGLVTFLIPTIALFALVMLLIVFAVIF